MRFSQIDDTNRCDHTRLTDGDACFYLFEYTSHQGFDFSQTNNLISNLKKKPSQRHRPGYHYKERAINSSAASMRQAFNPDWLASATLVPVPCSKARDHPDFDDRIERICRLVGADVRNLVSQTESTVASHEVGEGDRPTLEQLLEIYEIEECLTNPAPRAIGVVDDVLTVGTHFRAMSIVLGQRFPGVPITGLFVARRVFPDVALDFPMLT